MSDLLVLEAVSKSFDGILAVDEVSLTLTEGGRLALTGCDGAGKTTLLDLVAGALKPDRGSIRFDGTEISGLAADRVAALGIARVFDPPRPFAALSVEDSVTAAALLRERKVAAARRYAGEILERLELAPLRHRPAGRLKPLELKRLELARALATRPRLLLLDEVFAEAGPDETAALGELLRRDGLTLLLAEHDRHTAAPFADRILHLEHGWSGPQETPP